MKKMIFWMVLVFVIIGLDQWTKLYVKTHFYLGESIPVIPGFFNLTFVTNKGAAFGMLANANDLIRQILFLFVPVIACLWFVWLIWKSLDKHWLQPFAYSLIFSGAIGNLIDRFSMGYVVDFFDFYFQVHHFPAFNIADSAITVGACFLIIEGALMGLIMRPKSSK